MFEPDPHDKDGAFKVAISASSLAIMIVDFLWLISDEVKYIWPRFCASWTPRIYVLTRYVGMASQLYNVYFTVRMYLGVYTSPAGCRLWFAYQAVVIQFLLLFAEGLLMHRLYALFLRNQIILAILISFALSQIAAMGVSARLSLPSNRHTVTCMMVGSNPGNAFFSVTTMTTNSLVFFMTFCRYFRLPGMWRRQGHGRIVLRDSALSLCAIIGVMLFLTLCSLGVVKLKMGGNITYYWLVCVLWISIGRIIVNHQKIRDEGEPEEGSTWRGTCQLTSQIEMGESASSLDTECGSSHVRTPTSGTLGSLPSTPNSSQLSPSSPTSSDRSPKWFDDRSSSYGQHSSQSSNTELSTEVSLRRRPLSSVCTNDGDAPQTDDHPQADGDEHTQSPSINTQPSSPQSPSSEPSSPEASS